MKTQQEGNSKRYFIFIFSSFLVFLFLSSCFFFFHVLIFVLLNTVFHFVNFNDFFLSLLIEIHRHVILLSHYYFSFHILITLTNTDIVFFFLKSVFSILVSVNQNNGNSTPISLRQKPLINTIIKKTETSI